MFRVSFLAAVLTTCAFTIGTAPTALTADIAPTAPPAPAASVSAIVPAPDAPSSVALAASFATPAPENRPWAFWVWQNGNITREGITADLEAMKNVGIGGALIMELGYGNIPPRGPADFLSDEWRSIFRHMIDEAKRLDLKINMFASAAFAGGGGFWIRPEHSMQILTFSETTIAAASPRSPEIKLALPPAKHNFYRDVTVLAFPTPANAAKRRQPSYPGGGYKVFSEPNISKSNPVIAKKDIIDISYLMAADGTLRWTPPAGNWTILRVGHTSNGHLLLPPPISGSGLECDKLSVEATEIFFNGQMKRLIDENKNNAGYDKTLIATHIDSWEIGSQNWTPKMRDGFLKHSRYDILPFLPVFSGFQIDSPADTQRFLWDFRNTVSKMVIENYAGTIRRLANKNKLAFSIEAYDGAPCDALEYGGIADHPTGEFWTNKRCIYTDMRGMASSAHIYGKQFVPAEAFTAFPNERWTTHPRTFKPIGDLAFCEGANRFIFHAVTHQPRPDSLAPGMLYFKWGSHYERTQTWWEKSVPWHQYLTRCQYLLKQGKFVADIAYLEPENSPQRFTNHPRDGYLWDHVNAHVLKDATVDKNGHLVLSSGMTYKILVLPRTETMTLALAERIAALANAGATILTEKRPLKVPGLTNVAAEEQALTEKFASLFENKKIIVGKTPQEVLLQNGVSPDFVAEENLSFTHRKIAGGADIYFVANTGNKRVVTPATFRAHGKGVPQLWNPQNGKRIDAPIWEVNKDKTTRLLLSLAPSESVFVIFPENNNNRPYNEAVFSIERDGVTIYSGDASKINVGTPPVELEIVRAVYGVPGDAARSANVTSIVRQLAKRNPHFVRVGDVFAIAGDVAPNFHKTLTIDFKLDGVAKQVSVKHLTFAGVETAALIGGSSNAAAPQISDVEFCYLTDSDDPFQRLRFRTAGKYVLRTAGKVWEKTITPNKTIPLAGDWTLTFPAKSPLNLKELISWTSLPDPEHKYFSGTASYAKTFAVPAGFVTRGQRLILNLGAVSEIAEVFINGKKIETLWMPEKRVDITGIVRAGETARLEVRVTNLWQNRLIGDQFFPEVGVDRRGDGVLKSWPEWYSSGKPIPGKRTTFSTWDLYRKTDTLLPSGLFGPVVLEAL